MTSRPWQQKLWIATGLSSVVLLAAAVFTLGSLNTPIRPEQSNSIIILYALSVFISLALLVFLLILARNHLRMWSERKAGQHGARFKTKMVYGAMGVSLLPLVFLFLISYSLVNRTLNLWFPKPLEIANEQSRLLLTEMGDDASARLVDRARVIASHLSVEYDNTDASIQLAFGGGVQDAVWVLNDSGQLMGSKGIPAIGTADDIHLAAEGAARGDLWRIDGDIYRTGHAPWRHGLVYVARRLPPDYLQRYDEIQNQTETYQQQRQNIRIFKKQILLALALITVLLLFSTTWVALFLSKQVTVPIQALAEATQAIARGNFDHRVTVQGQDELGTLVTSFNEMTAQLGEGRRQINEFTRNLQLAFEERERRRKLMETILESIPTGVLSLDANAHILRVNSAVSNIFGDRARESKTLPDLLGDEASRMVMGLMRRSLRLGIASREIEMSSSGRLARMAVTVSSLGSRRENSGFVVVIDDLTELLRAQKAAAWQEVAKRIAHEIKNPLTPIMLSAQRLKRHLDRTAGTQGGTNNSDLPSLVAECADLIEREVHTLESLVDEFSQFARFPAARLAPADLNAIAGSALALFQDRLEGIIIRTEFAPQLPAVKADAELLRRVFVNLIDNAAEAMEDSTVRRLLVATRCVDDGDSVEIEISDTGHGISPEDKDRLFLPHFSTKERGTGLGLAISSRIVAEHNGTLRVMDNNPLGSRFLIRFPAEVTAPAVAPAAASIPVSTNGSANGSPVGAANGSGNGTGNVSGNGSGAGIQETPSGETVRRSLAPEE